MKKKRIAVFDFNAEDCAAMAGVVRICFPKEAAVVVEFTAMQPFAYDFKDNRPDMAFIAVNNMMGVETARLIREIDPYCPLFFVSDVGDYGMEGYRVHALDYLVKPLTPERVAESVKRIDMKCLNGLLDPDNP